MAKLGSRTVDSTGRRMHNRSAAVSETESKDKTQNGSASFAAASGNRAGKTEAVSDARLDDEVPKHGSGIAGIIIVLRVVRLFCMFTLTYCSVNVIMMLCFPDALMDVHVFRHYSMTVPASVLVGLNAGWICVLATSIKWLHEAK